MNAPTTTIPYERIILGLVLALTFALGLFRVAVTPLWIHYDEASHYDYMHYLITHRSLPQSGVPDPVILPYLRELDPARVYEMRVCEGPNNPVLVCWAPAQQYDEMPGYYALQAALQIALRPRTLIAQVTLARIVSVIMSVGAAAAMYALIKHVFPAQPLLAVGVPLVMALNFAYTDLMSALSNDVGAVLAFHLMLLAMITTLMRGLSVKRAALIAGSLALCLLAKSSAWMALPLAVLGALLLLISDLPMKVQLGVLAVFAVIGALILFEWVPGIGPQFRSMFNEMIPVPSGGNYTLASWYQPKNWPIYWPAVRWQFVSFWSTFGTGQTGLPVIGAAVFAVLSLVSGIGLVRLAITHMGNLTTAQAQGLLFLAVAVALVLAMSLLRIDPPNAEGKIYYIPTARHFYIVAGPALLFWLMGLGSWIAPRYRRMGLAALALLLYGLSLWSLLTYQMQFFRQYM